MRMEADNLDQFEAVTFGELQEFKARFGLECYGACLAGKMGIIFDNGV